MAKKFLIGFLLVIILPIILSDGNRDYGESCSLRSQIANYFRQNDSAEGCISAKGLVCVSHKCTCADPSNIYEVITPSVTETLSNLPGDIANSAKQSIVNFFKGTSSTTTPTPGAGKSEGRCVGRAGSPCFSHNSTCVQHAKCQGSPIPLCKCQGIYASNTTGFCSKSQSVINQGLKSIIG